MRISTRLLIIGTALFLGGTVLSAAQDTPQPTNALESCQAKGALTDDDTTVVRNWVAQRIQTLTTGTASAVNTAVAELRSNKKGTPAFIQAYVNACVQAVAGTYESAERDAATRLIALLNVLNEVEAAPVFNRALSDARVPVRAAAAIGLRNLQAKITAAGGNIPGDALASLREAGKKEESAVTLKLIYEAMNFERAADSKPVAESVAAVLVARGEQYGSGEVKAVAADRAGLTLATRLAGQLDEDGRRRLAIASAKMLQYGVKLYTSEFHQLDDKNSSPVQIQLRDRIELFIEAAETLLSTLTRAQDGPKVTEAMQQSVQADKSVNMKIEMNKWADLIQQQYQVDVHLEATEATAEGTGETPSEEP